MVVVVGACIRETILRSRLYTRCVYVYTLYTRCVRTVCVYVCVETVEREREKMVYVRVWEEFMREAEALWLRDPLRTRVVRETDTCDGTTHE